MGLSPTEDKTVSPCKHLLATNSYTKSIRCGFNDRGWIGQNNCGICTHQNQEKIETLIKPNIEATTAPIREDFACPNSVKEGWMIYGRLCGFDRCSCFNWNKPELVKICPVIEARKQRDILGERIENDFYLSIEGAGSR